ncbi:MAG TPA: ribosomal protein L7/L12 [Woeseiaceae bacterium]
MKPKTTVITENDLPPEVIRAIEAGRKIEAIKLLREATGLGLPNAKVLVDKAGRQRAPKNSHPNIVDDSPNIGRLLKTLFLVVLAFAFYRYYYGGA